MIVYKITNLVNGKLYIGQTKASLQRRFKSHCRQKFCRLLKAAIDKYGVENFAITPIVRCSTLEEMNAREVTCIRLFKTLSTEGGYNLTPGGWSYERSADHRMRMSIAMKGKMAGSANPMFGTRMSDEQKKKMSLITKGRVSAMKGKKHSEETKAKMSFAMRGKLMAEETRKKIGDALRGQPKSAATKEKLSKANAYRSIPIFCFQNGQIYPSISAASAALGLRSGIVSRVVSGKLKSTGGYSFAAVTQRAS